MLRSASLMVLLLSGCASVLGADFDDLEPIGQGGISAGGHAGELGGAGSSGGGGTAGEGGMGGSGPVGPSLPLVCGDMSGLEPGAPWPMAGYCPTRQARAGAASFSSPEERWTATLDHQIFTEPVIGADGTAYVVTYDISSPLTPGRLQAVRDGVAQWFVEVSSLASPALAADGRLVVFDGTRVRWITPAGDDDGETPLPGAVYGSPVIAQGGRILAPTTAGLVAISAAGSIEWTAPTPEPLRTPVAVGLDGTAYVASVLGTLYAIDTAGVIEWDFPTGETAELSPLVASADTIIFATYERVYAIDGEGGEKWSFSTGMYPTIPPVVFGDVTYAVSLGAMNDMTLWALDDLGVPTWSVDGIGTMGRPALSKDGLLVSFVAYRPGVLNPEVLARHPADGAIYWSLEDRFQSTSAYPPAAWGSDGVLYVPVINRLHALEP